MTSKCSLVYWFTWCNTDMISFKRTHYWPWEFVSRWFLPSFPLALSASVIRDWFTCRFPEDKFCSLSSYLWLFFPKHCIQLQNSGRKIKKINYVVNAVFQVLTIAFKSICEAMLLPKVRGIFFVLVCLFVCVRGGGFCWDNTITCCILCLLCVISWAWTLTKHSSKHHWFVSTILRMYIPADHL